MTKPFVAEGRKLPSKTLKLLAMAVNCGAVFLTSFSLLFGLREGAVLKTPTNVLAGLQLE